MTRFKESAKRIVSDVAKTRNGWHVTFVDGSCKLITKSQKKGTATIEPGKILLSCRNYCAGPDQNGKCTWRPRGPRTNNVPDVDCHEQFVYAFKPYNFGKEKPKFARSAQKMSYRIQKYRTLRRLHFNDPERWEVTFEDGTTKVLLKSLLLGRKNLKHGNHLVPCGEECNHRDGKCIHCHGKMRGTECAQQFYFCRKFLCRHKNDKQK